MGASGQDSKGSAKLDLLTIVALVAGVLLVASSAMDVFTVTGLGGDEIPSASRNGFDNHGPSLALIGVTLIAAVFLSRSTEQWLPAAAASGLALVALAIVLLADLPDANDTELLTNGRLGSSHAASGLWVSLAAALMAAAACAGIGWILRRRRRD